MSESFIHQVAGYAAASPTRAAVVSATTSLSYAQLLSRVKSTAASLSRSTIGPGTTVGISVADEVDHLVISLALMGLGADQVTLATFEEAQARALVATRAGVTHIVSPEAHYAIHGTEFIAWTAARAVADFDFGKEDDIRSARLLLKTSGTTGSINLVEFSGEQIGQQATRHQEYSGERLLRLASIEHNNSKRHRLYCVWNGGTNVFKPQGEFEVVRFCLEREVSCLDISRMHAAALASSGESARLGGIKIRTGGSSIPIDLRRRVENNATANLYVRYAATECGAISMACPGEHDDDESVGRPLPGVELEILGQSGTAPPGVSGLIRLRAPGMATGYLDNASRSQQSFKDGWFYPGDVGCLRSDGHLIVHGRQDDMMILNGVNIYPTEIERVLERHPAVKVAAALPVPSAVHGQIPVAAVELLEDCVVTALELQGYARKELGLRTPRRVVILDSLPRNAQGKIMRAEIAKTMMPGARKSD